jgi:hypothetical protein
MTFGTSSTARLLNMLPLNQRFRVDAAEHSSFLAVRTDEVNEYILRHGWWGALLREPQATLPGWDADGREVEA